MGSRSVLLARFVLCGIAVVLAFMGLMFMIAAVYALIRAVVGFVMLLVAAAILYVAIKMIKKPMTAEDYDNIIFALARRKDGKLTLSEVTAELEISVKQAREVLNRLSIKEPDACSMEIGEDGVTETYVFPAFLPKKKTHT